MHKMPRDLLGCRNFDDELEISEVDVDHSSTKL